MVTEFTSGRLLRLPWDYRLLGLKPDEQLVADAVRASSSIPFYFDPVTIRDAKSGEDTTLVDGGVLSNFPIEIFDRSDGAEPRWPTLGVKIIPQMPAGTAQLFPDIAMLAAPVLHLPLIRLAERVVATAIVGDDQSYLERPCVSPQGDPGRHQRRRDRRVRCPQGNARRSHRQRRHSRRAVPRRLGLGALQKECRGVTDEQ